MSIPQALPLAPTVITREFLQGFVGKTVEDFCPNGTDGNKQGAGRSLVVSDLFNACPTRGPWDEKPATLTCCLIFAVGAKGASLQRVYGASTQAFYGTFPVA